MLHISGLSKSFGVQRLFKGVSLSIAPGQKVGLIGPPGSGKTTLLRIILGLEGYEEGVVLIRPYTWFGYLPQYSTFVGSRTFRDCLKMAEEDFLVMRARRRSLEGVEGHPPDRSERVQGYTDPQFHKVWGNVSVGLKLQHISPTSCLASLQAEEQRRIWLASLLLTQPDFLLLDEPTASLEPPVLEWLDNHLHAYPGNVLLVSHDRTLLDKVVDVIWEVIPDQETVRAFPGNYRAYLAAGTGLPARPRPWVYERYPRVSNY